MAWWRQERTSAPIPAAATSWLCGRSGQPTMRPAGRASLAGCSASTSATASAKCASRARPGGRSRSRPRARRIGADRVVRRRRPIEGVQRSRAHVAAGALRRRGRGDPAAGSMRKRPEARRKSAVRRASGLTRRSRSRVRCSWLPTRRLRTASSVGQCTSLTHPIRSKPRISNAEVSSWPGSSPWRAERGNAWWPLCQDSPMLTTARTPTLPLRSLVMNGRRPNMWHTELMLHVAWCNTHTRTRPAQNRALTAAPRVPPSSQPRPNGRASDRRAPHREHPVEHDDVPVGQEVGGVTARRRAAGGEQPPEVGVPQALQLAGETATVVLRRVRVAGRVGEHVMAPVVGHPTDRTALVGHRTEGDEGDLERPAGGERPVGEQPMESDRDAVAGEDVEGQRQDQVAEMDAAPPEADHTDHQSGEGDADDQHGDHPGRPPGGASLLLDASTAGSGEHGGESSSSVITAPWRRCLRPGGTEARPRSGAVAARRRRPAWLRPWYTSIRSRVRAATARPLRTSRRRRRATTRSVRPPWPGPRGVPCAPSPKR